MATLQLNTARVFLPLLKPARYKGAYGGRGGAKSHFFAESLVEKCLAEPGTRFACIREVQKSLEQSVKRLLEDKIRQMGVGHLFRVLNTHIETPGDGIIIFNGMQNHTADSIKSLEGYHGAWVEEAQSLSQRSLDLLRPTIRMPGSELWFSWNPRFPTDPIDKLLRSKDTPPDAVVVNSSWQNNPWFPDVLRRDMEWDRKVDLDKYLHIWMGGYEKHSNARVFKNWRVEEFSTPKNVVFRHGGDWGFSADPTVLNRMWEELPKNPDERKKLYIDWEVYQIGCEIDHTPELFDTLGCAVPISPDLLTLIRANHQPTLDMLTSHGYRSARQWPIIADSARPETISYLRRHGYPRIESAVKGANSVKEGVIFLQGYDIIIHPRCTHTVDEFTMYSYKVDPVTEEVTPVLEDKKNHVIDATRYAAEPLRGVGIVNRESEWG